jgi:monothiol glutaredoxin
VSELNDRIKEIIETEPVALFMKGTPQFIACGNSARALGALRAIGAPVGTVDVLPDPQIRQELSALSGWPTIPQVFVGGELVGGADITEELFESGELERKLDEKLGNGWREQAGEHVIDLPASGGSPFRVVPQT